MHPIERLRYVARASGADQELLVRETAHALGAFLHVIASHGTRSFEHAGGTRERFAAEEMDQVCDV